MRATSRRHHRQDSGNCAPVASEVDCSFSPASRTWQSHRESVLVATHSGASLLVCVAMTMGASIGDCPQTRDRTKQCLCSSPLLSGSTSPKSAAQAERSALRSSASRAQHSPRPMPSWQRCEPTPNKARSQKKCGSDCRTKLAAEATASADVELRGGSCSPLRAGPRWTVLFRRQRG